MSFSVNPFTTFFIPTVLPQAFALPFSPLLLCVLLVEEQGEKGSLKHRCVHGQPQPSLDYRTGSKLQGFLPPVLLNSLSTTTKQKKKNKSEGSYAGGG